MRNEIAKILEKYVDIYNFVSVDTYKQKRSELGLEDTLSDYRFLDDYKTIITVAIPYPSKLEKWKKKGYGILSRYSYGEDYHRVFRRILDNITTDFESLGIRHKASVDISGVDERFAGYLSNMGWLGKNQYLIVEGYGTYTFLATILVDIELETIPRVQDDCGECTKCIDACPSGALDNGFEMDKCISHISQEKIPFTEEQIGHFKTMIYGCDICQRVCPKNGAVDIHRYQEFEPTGIENISLKEILRMSNKEYMKRYGTNASSWRGATIIKRNALCLAVNQKQTDLIPEIQKSMVKLEGNVWYNKTAELVLSLLERRE